MSSFEPAEQFMQEEEEFPDIQDLPEESNQNSSSQETESHTHQTAKMGLFSGSEEEKKKETVGAYSWFRRLTFSHIEGIGEHSGISYGTNYTTFGILMAPDYRSGHLLPLVDMRVHQFDNNTFAANFGFIGRYIPSPGSFCEILGFNSYFDFRQGFIGNYYQIGLGFEILGRRWDFRGNGYVPLGRARNLRTCNYNFEGGYCASYNDTEFGTYGFNLEVGWLSISSKNFFLYLALGPYYLVRTYSFSEPLRGVKARVRPQYKDFFAVDCSFSYDSVYKQIFQTEFILYLPLYQRASHDKKTKSCISERQIFQPVERFEVMPLGREDYWEKNY
jgi:hypothetical protein